MPGMDVYSYAVYLCGICFIIIGKRGILKNIVEFTTGGICLDK